MSLVNDAMPWGGLKRVVIAPNHDIVGYLHPDNSDKWEDGTDVNWLEVENNGYNVMVEIPKFYYVKKVDGDRVYFGVADKVPDSTEIPSYEWEIHPAFMKYGEIEVNYRYFGAYLGWVDGQDRLRSLPYKTVTGSQTIDTLRTQARNNGNGWEMVDYYLLYAIQMLYITEYGHPDSQTKIGRGYVDGNAEHVQTGNTNQYGNKTFGETTGKYQMSYRGIEDFWGNYFYWIDGIVSNVQRNILIGNKGFNDSGSGYELHTIPNTANTSGNIRDIQDDKALGFLIKTRNSNTNYNDGLYDRGSLVASRVARFGGDRSNGSNAGAFQLLLNVASSSGANGSARLAL